MFQKLTILLSISLISCVPNENEQMSKFRVYGNCGMCEQKIEGSVKNIEGIFSVDWNPKNDTLTVSYNYKKIELNDIKKKIAEVGYDTDTFKANDKVYNNLHYCCQYERQKK